MKNALKMNVGIFCYIIVIATVNSRRHRHHRKQLAESPGEENDPATSNLEDTKNNQYNTDLSVDNSVPSAVAANNVASNFSPNVPITANTVPIYNAYYRNVSPPKVAENNTPFTYTQTQEAVQTRDLNLNQWKNHTIPFLKEFKSQIDNGNIKHHNYEELTWFLKFFAEEYPHIARLYNIGSSVQNRKLWVMELTDNPGRHEPGEPEMKYIGNIHGNEVIGREILLQLVKYLCENYDKNNSVKELVDKTRIHVLPSMNPDGYELAAAHKKSNNPDITEDVIGRLNANGVDLNRNFPDQFFDSNIDNNEPETQAVMEWIKKYPFVLSASFHSGALVVTYPFDDSPSGQSQYSATPDDDLFRTLAKTYSENHPQMHLANPKMNCTRALRRFTDGISNGAAWSSLSGGMQDFNYVRSNCYEVTVELGCRKFPNDNDLSMYWNDNRKSLLKFIEMANKGVKGFVMDENGNKIKGARISVGDRKHDIRTADEGDYWRLLVPGTYDLEAHAKGFKPSAVSVEIPPGEATVVNFTLSPKQVDELEQTLGHANRATVISQNLMYRYDGRDSGRDSVPKEVIQRIEETNNQQYGREGTSEQQDTVAMDPDVLGSGSGADETAQAQKLAENLALNNMPRFKAANYKRDQFQTKATSPYKINVKRTKITRPEKTKKSKSKPNKKTKSRINKATNTTNFSGNKGLTSSTNNTDPAVIKAVTDMFHMSPSLGMHVKCKVPGKADQLKGSLRYMGHITNLPKRNNVIVAGLELDHEEELGTDGTFLGKRYFIATPKTGYFVPVKNCSPA